MKPEYAANVGDVDALEKVRLQENAETERKFASEHELTARTTVTEQEITKRAATQAQEETKRADINKRDPATRIWQLGWTVAAMIILGGASAIDVALYIDSQKPVVASCPPCPQATSCPPPPTCSAVLVPAPAPASSK